MDRQSVNWRIFGIVAAAVIAGALIAVEALSRTHGVRNTTVLRPLVLTVVATPFVTLLGSLLARRSRGWQATFTCCMTYFFSIFVAARIERVVLGEQAATATGHTLYFRLTIGLNVVAGLLWALQVARSKGTMPLEPHEPQHEDRNDGAIAA